MNDIIAEQVRRMKCGDEAAFDWLYENYVNPLYRMAFLITGNRGDSEDIVQETFVKCYLNRQSIREEKAFESWLYQILVRTAWRFHKQRPKDVSLEELQEESRETGGGQGIWSDAGSPQPLLLVLKEEESRTLWKAVQQLEIRQRTVVILYYYQEMPVKDIARITGSLSGTVKSRLFQARSRLKRILEDEEAGRISLMRKERLV